MVKKAWRGFGFIDDMKKKMTNGFFSVNLTLQLILNNTRHASWGFDPKCAPWRVTYFRACV